MELSKEEKEAASQKIALLAVLRTKGEFSEDEIAEKLGFRGEWGQSPSERMYVWLKDRDLPEWLVYPETPPDRSKQNLETENRVSGEGTGAKSAPEKSERKARATGDAVKLPPASAAEDLFRKDQERLAAYVYELSYRRENLQAERFILVTVPDEEDLDLEIFSRVSFYRCPDEDSEGEFLEEEWEKICERYGVDPTVEEFMAYVKPGPSGRGGGPVPRGGLATLIAVHALMCKPLDRLIDVLHPDPSSADREKIREYADLMRVNAEKLGVAVRGGKVRRGHRPAEISSVEMFDAWFVIGPLHKKGLSEQQILEELRIRGAFWEEPYEPGEEGDHRALEEIRRTINLQLEMPEG